MRIIVSINEPLVTIFSSVDTIQMATPSIIIDHTRVNAGNGANVILDIGGIRVSFKIPLSLDKNVQGEYHKDEVPLPIWNSYPSQRMSLAFIIKFQVVEPIDFLTSRKSFSPR